MKFATEFSFVSQDIFDLFLISIILKAIYTYNQYPSQQNIQSPQRKSNSH